MGAERESKAAIRELAGLLGMGRVQARSFLRDVQVGCGRPVPFRAIVDQVRASGIEDVEGIVRLLTASGPITRPA